MPTPSRTGLPIGRDFLFQARETAEGPFALRTAAKPRPMKPRPSITHIEDSGTPEVTVVLVKPALIEVPGPPTWLALKMKLIGTSTNKPSLSFTVPVRVTVIAFIVARLIDPMSVSNSVNLSPVAPVQVLVTSVVRGPLPAARAIVDNGRGKLNRVRWGRKR